MNTEHQVEDSKFSGRGDWRAIAREAAGEITKLGREWEGNIIEFPRVEAIILAAMSKQGVAIQLMLSDEQRSMLELGAAQPPATASEQKWTPESVKTVIGVALSVANASEAFEACKRLASAHNAALAAEREKAEIKLATTISKEEHELFSINRDLDANNRKLYQQLVAAQAAIAKVVERAKLRLRQYGSGAELTASFIIGQLGNVDLFALDRHDAEVRSKTLNEILCCRHANDTRWNEGACPVCELKPLVDLLQRLQRWSNGYETSCHVFKKIHGKAIAATLAKTASRKDTQSKGEKQ